MRASLIALVAALLAAPASAQPTASSDAPRVEVRLSSFKFEPSSLRLQAGRPVVLHLVNTAGGGHNFSAPEFFAAAQVRGEDRAFVSKGSVEVPGHSSRDIALVPSGGRYRLKCTHTFHTTFGMKGSIVVE